MRLWSLRYVMGLGIAGMLGCQSATTPASPPSVPTVRVANANCAAASACRTVEIRAFVWTFPVPQPIWGLEVVGEVHGPADCLTFPASWTFSVIGPTDSVAYKWTPKDNLFLIAVDSAVFHARADGPLILGMTTTFAPAEAAGWVMALPGGSSTSPSPPIVAGRCDN